MMTKVNMGWSVNLTNNVGQFRDLSNKKFTQYSQHNVQVFLIQSTDIYSKNEANKEYMQISVQTKWNMRSACVYHYADKTFSM